MHLCISWLAITRTETTFRTCITGEGQAIARRNVCCNQISNAFFLIAYGLDGWTRWMEKKIQCAIYLLIRVPYMIAALPARKTHIPFYFQCNIAIMNFLVSHMCEIRFNDVIGQSTAPMYSLMQ